MQVVQVIEEVSQRSTEHFQHPVTETVTCHKPLYVIDVQIAEVGQRVMCSKGGWVEPLFRKL